MSKLTRTPMSDFWDACQLLIQSHFFQNKHVAKMDNCRMILWNVNETDRMRKETCPDELQLFRVQTLTNFCKYPNYNNFYQSALLSYLIKNAIM